MTSICVDAGATSTQNANSERFPTVAIAASQIQRPDWIRLPKPGHLCAFTGLSRSKINELILPSAANGHKPAVKSCSLCKPGAVRGTRLIHLASLLAYLEKHAEGGHQPGFFSEWRRSQNNLDFHSSITFDFGEREWFLTWICKRTIRRWSVVFVMNLLPLNLFDGLVSALIGGLIVVLGWRRDQCRHDVRSRPRRSPELQ
jgi:hypothetical protein